MASDKDIAFCKKAIEIGLLTPDRVDECLRVVDQRKQLGIEKSAAQVARELGFLDEAECQSIVQALSPGKAQPRKRKLDVPQDLIPGYRIDEKIGQGAMSSVYKAWHLSLKKDVAIKIMATELTTDPEYRERFLREARSAAKLDHPNIIRAYDVGEKEGYYFFVMEYVQGRNLEEILREQGPLPEKQVLQYMIEVARALECAHQAGVVHRDIKPENILLTPENTIKLTDLGLAKDLNVDGTLTETGMTLGTPTFFSPEQAAGRSDLDVRSDLYSLGVTLFYLLSGEFPFDGDSPTAIMKKHLRTPAPKVTQVNPKISRPTAKLVARLLEKNRKKRFQSPGDLIAAAEKILKAPSGRRRPAAASGPGEESADKPAEETETPSRLPLYGGVVGGAILLLGLLLLFQAGATDGDSEGTNGDTDQTQPDPRAVKAEEALEEILADRAFATDTELMQRFESLVLDYGGTEAAKKAQKELDKLKEKRRDEAERLFADAKAEADRLLEQDRDYDALRVFEDLPGWIRTGELEEKIKAEQTAIRDSLRKKFERDAETFKRLLAEERYTKAEKLVKAIAGYGTPEIVLAAKKLEGELQSALEEKKKQEAEARRKRDLALYARGLDEVIQLAKKGAYDEAQERIRALRATADLEITKTRFTQTYQAVGELKTVRQSALEALVDKIGEEHVFPLADGGTQEGKISGILKGKILLGKEQIPIEAVRLDERLRLAGVKIGPGTATFLFDSALAHLYADYHTRAKELLRQATAKGGDLDGWGAHFDLVAHLRKEKNRGTPSFEPIAKKDDDPEETTDPNEEETTKDPKAETDDLTPRLKAFLATELVVKPTWKKDVLTLSYDFESPTQMADWAWKREPERVDFDYYAGGSGVYFGTGSGKSAGAKLIHKVPLRAPLTIEYSVHFYRKPRSALFYTVLLEEKLGTNYAVDFGAQLRRRVNGRTRRATPIGQPPSYFVKGRRETQIRIVVKDGELRSHVAKKQLIKVPVKAEKGFFGFELHNCGFQLRNLKVTGRVDEEWAKEKLKIEDDK